MILSDFVKWFVKNCARHFCPIYVLCRSHAGGRSVYTYSFLYILLANITTVG